MNKALKIILIIVLAYVSFACFGLQERTDNIALSFLYLIGGLISTFSAIILIVGVANTYRKD